jgi:acetate kinase
MADAILVLNAGSSSLKFSVFQVLGGWGRATASPQLSQIPGGSAEPRPQPPDVAGDDGLMLHLRGQVDSLHSAPHFAAYDSEGNRVAEHRWDADAKLDSVDATHHVLGWLQGDSLSKHDTRAVGHRVVHGGLDFTGPVLIDDDVLARLDKLVPLAPLHQPQNLAVIRAVAQALPETPQVASFDTSFHRQRCHLDQLYALPRHLADAGIRRYGFHGLSYEYIASRLREVDPAAYAGRTVVAHLGNGASMCALRAGKSAATTMGFTALDGLPMGTRCGSIDPGVVLYLIDEQHLDPRQIEHMLYSESGLLGISGVASDMRTLLESPDAKAKEAIDYFVYRIGRELGSLTSALGGLDALVFTAGIGEHAAPIRAAVCRAAAWLGVELDDAKNAVGGPQINASTSRVAVRVIPTDEELMIARHTERVLGGAAGIISDRG